jgi:hypothetical protein
VRLGDSARVVEEVEPLLPARPVRRRITSSDTVIAGTSVDFGSSAASSAARAAE